MSDQNEVTVILADIGKRPSATDELLAVVYAELRALAGSFFAMQAANHTLQPTALVHEAYVRLVGGREIEWTGRAHFYAVAAKAMRQILVNHAVAKQAKKRGGGAGRVTLVDPVSAESGRDIDLPALNEALNRLEQLDERQVRIVELRYFGGMTMEEVAHVLDVSLSTVEKDWRMAKLWLQRELAN